MGNQSKYILLVKKIFSIYVIISYRIPDGKSPRFPKKPTIRQEGDILIMECVLEGHPAPDIKWYQENNKIQESERFKMSRKAISKDTYLLTLEIHSPVQSDGGNYRCNAFNLFGESNANIALNFAGINSCTPKFISFLCFELKFK